MSPSQLDHIYAQAAYMRATGIAIYDAEGAAGAHEALDLLAQATTLEDTLRQHDRTPWKPEPRPYQPRAKLPPLDLRPIEELDAAQRERTGHRKAMPEAGQLFLW